MSDKPKLTILLPSESLPLPNKLARCCDKQHTSEESLDCDWWINSKEHNYCFWTYIRSRSDERGEMLELVQKELARIMGWSNTKTHFMLKEALIELRQALETYNAVSLLEVFQINEISDSSTANLAPDTFPDTE